MSSAQSTEEETVQLTVESVGGIDHTDVTFSPGVTILAGRNATNRTSLLQALMAALGSEHVSLKGDAEEGHVGFAIGDRTYTRTLARTGETTGVDQHRWRTLSRRTRTRRPVRVPPQDARGPSGRDHPARSRKTGPRRQNGPTRHARVFALAGYLAHDLYESMPVMLLDSLETIDSDRIVALIDYFGDYAEYVVVALLPEDAAALSNDHERITEI